MLLFLILLAISTTFAQPTCDSSPNSRIACAPDQPTNQTLCQQRGCCWSLSESSSTGPPSCFLPNSYTGYKILSIRDDWSKVFVTLQRVVPSGFAGDIISVLLEVTFLNDESLRLRITDKDQSRFVIPFPKLNLPVFPHAFNPIYEFNVTSNGSLSIKRRSTGKTIFAVDLTKLIYSNQFHQITTRIASNFVYGLGEHKAPLKKQADWSVYTIFNHDHWPEEQMNLYGSHPFYLSVEDTDGNSNGVLLFNSNAMDVVLQPEPSITWRPIGGILDYFIFLGPKPDSVIQQLTQVIGRPSMPPFWSLGFHLGRCWHTAWTLDQQKAITQRMIDAKIPFDVQWSCLDYMNDNYDMFTINKTRYAGFTQFIDDLHNKGMHYVPIADPGIGVHATGYQPYEDGLKMDIFIKNATDQVLVGAVWQPYNKTVFPDFTNPKAVLFWVEQFKKFYKDVPFDGIWLDMNEISNIKVNGSVDGCPDNQLENPSYVPGNKPLKTNTICLSAKQYAGVQYDLHNLYSVYEAHATNLMLRVITKKRPFIISRASFIGQGQYSGHWNGDGFSKFDHMKWSIASIINFNMFGMPLVGADICGYFHPLGPIQNDTRYRELCSRWHQLGAFYPFSRNLNEKPFEQDPAALGPVVAKSARDALTIRYSLLPLLYTLFYQAEVDGTPVIRQLFYEFPNDTNAYQTDTQFMWGSAVMIIPVVEEKQREVNAYFPAGKWYLYDVDGINQTIVSRGQNVTLPAPVDKINVAIRGGSMVPVLKPKTTTTETRKNNFTLLVALDGNGCSSGQLFWDDGDSIDTVAHGNYSLVKFVAKDRQINVNPIHLGYGPLPLDRIKIIGLDEPKSQTVIVDGTEVSSDYDSVSGVLTVDNLALDMRLPINVGWQ